MSVLGKLAFSQIKQKKTRTVITILAIVLSSSLLTAVVNFVVSGNTMLRGFLGEDYGVYGGAYTLLLLIPAVILGMLIVSMSVIVISNVFRMSANERIAEFGALKCVGATKKQIYRTIMYECFFLCTVAVPLGVLFGYFLSFLGIRAVNVYMEELNVLTRAMMISVTFELFFVFSPLAVLVSVIISVCTAAFSAMIPAKKAMGMAALECLRSGGETGAALDKSAKVDSPAASNGAWRLKHYRAAGDCPSRHLSSQLADFMSHAGTAFGSLCAKIKRNKKTNEKCSEANKKHDKAHESCNSISKRHNMVNGKHNVEYQLARKNTVSGSKRMKSAVAAFSISLILFVTMSGLKAIADGVSDYIYVDMGYTVMADYTSNYKNEINEKTGRREYFYARTIDSALGQEITEELAAYEGGEVYGMGQDYFTYVTTLREDEITEEMREALLYQGENGVEEETESIDGGKETGKAESRKRAVEAENTGGERAENAEIEKRVVKYELRVERIIIDEEHYKELCEQAGAEYGGVILINDYKYNYRGSEKHIVPFPISVSSFVLESADGTCETVAIDGILAGEGIPKELLYPNTKPVRLIVPDGDVRGYNWMASPKDEAGYMEYAKAVLEKHFPQGGLEYGEAGFVSRVFGAQDFSKIMNIAIVVASVFLYGFVFLLGMIGMLNVISTMLFSVKMRAREFAVLQSIGMTYGALQKMLYLESVFCAGKALVTGLPVGIILVLLMKYCVQKMLPIPFKMPWGMIIGAAAAAFVLMGGTVRVSLNTLKKQSLIRTIRM